MAGRPSRLSVFLPEKMHIEVETRGTGRIFSADANGQNGRPYAILPGGVLTNEGWEHTVVPEDEMLLSR